MDGVNLVVPTMTTRGVVEYRIDRRGGWETRSPGVYSISGKQLVPEGPWVPIDRADVPSQVLEAVS